VQSDADPVTQEPTTQESADATEEMSESLMVFPKLEKESPASSIHEAAKSEEVHSLTAEVETSDGNRLPLVDEDFDECADVEWDDEEDEEDAFLTDDEYDILDASDEEYLSEQQKLVKK
jgi:next-to-BRCA1 protein 1